MNKRVDVAELELDGGPHVVETHDLREGADNLQRPLETPPMVVGHFQNEELFEDVTVDHVGSPMAFSPADGARRLGAKPSPAPAASHESNRSLHPRSKKQPAGSVAWSPPP